MFYGFRERSVPGEHRRVFYIRLDTITGFYENHATPDVPLLSIICTSDNGYYKVQHSVEELKAILRLHLPDPFGDKE